MKGGERTCKTKVFGRTPAAIQETPGHRLDVLSHIRCAVFAFSLSIKTSPAVSTYLKELRFEIVAEE